MDERSARQLETPVGGWTPAELAAAHRVAVGGAADAEPTYCALVGSHAYGFADPGSDVDLLGSHEADGRRYALLDRPAECVRIAPDHGRAFGGDGSVAAIDLESPELRSFTGRLARGDVALWEAVLAAPVVRDDAPAATDALREVLRGSLPFGLSGHYAGMARHLATDPGSVTELCYALRAGFAADYVATHGTILVDVHDLAEAVGGDRGLVADLVAAKRAGRADPTGVSGELHDRVAAEVEGRLADLDPAKPTAESQAGLRAALDDWQWETRGWAAEDH